MSKQFWAIIAIIVLVFLGIVIISNHNSSDGSSGKPTSHIEGQGTSGVKLIEYGDYECPICEEFYSVVKQVQAKYDTQIYFQFRNLPLTQIHANAFAGARAAEAAGLQGKYFQMHDELYENQNAWASASDPTTFFATYAKDIGLNVTKFKTDYASARVNNAINADLAAFKKTGDAQATPTFYLDGKKLDNNSLIDQTTGPSVAAFSKIIDAEIAAKTKS
jgi:protein-disulfide isomerase